MAPTVDRVFDYFKNLTDLSLMGDVFGSLDDPVSFASNYNKFAPALLHLPLGARMPCSYASDEQVSRYATVPGGTRYLRLRLQPFCDTFYAATARRCMVLATLQKCASRGRPGAPICEAQAK